MVISLQNVKTLYSTHRNHSESCVNYTGSNGGIDRLLNSGIREDTSGVIEYLKVGQPQKTEHERVHFFYTVDM